MAKSTKVSKTVAATNNNNKGKSKVTVLHNQTGNVFRPKPEPEFVAAANDPGLNLVYLFSKQQEVPMDQLTAEQIGAEYKPEVTKRVTDGEALPFMKATFERIGEVVLSIPGNGQVATIKRLEAIYNMTDSVDVEDADVFDTPLASKFAANPTAQKVYELGRQLDATSIAHMVTIVEGRKVYEGGFAVLMKDWERQFCTFDADGVLTNDPAVSLLPRAGSGTKRNPKRGNEETDYYKIEKKDGTGNERGSICDDFVIGSAIGQPFNTWKEIKRRAASDMWRINNADKAKVRELIVDPKLDVYIEAAFEADKEAWNTLDRSQNRDRNTLVSRWRQAIGFRQQRAAIDDLPCCEVAMLGEDTGAAARVSTPVQILYAAPQRKIATPSKGLTIGQFLKINVPAAKLAAELEGKTHNKTVPVGLVHLLGTLKAAPKAPEPKETPVKGKINNYEEFRSGIDSLSAYAQEKGKFEELQTVLNKNDDESKLLATSLAPLSDFLINLDPFFRVTYQLVVAEESKQREKANAEKLKAIAENDEKKFVQLTKQQQMKR